MKSGLYKNNFLVDSFENLIKANKIKIATKNDKLYIESVDSNLVGYLVIDTSIYGILKYAFKDTNLSGVFLPTELKCIEYSAFYNLKQIKLDFENVYGWQYLNYEVVGNEERFHDYTRPSMGKEIVDVYDYVLKDVEVLDNAQIQKFIIKNGNKFICNEDYLSIFYSIILNDAPEIEFYKAYKNLAFKNWLLGILPEVEASRLQAQITNWHVYGVLDHILHTVKHINSLTKNMSYANRKLFAISAFFHDLGKPCCATKKEVKGVMCDTFKGHATKGVEIWNRVSGNFILSKKDIGFVAFLIENHDFLMDFNVYNVEKVDWKLIREELFKNLDVKEDRDGWLYGLVALALADNMAQNLDLTYKNVELLNSFMKDFEKSGK